MSAQVGTIGDIRLRSGGHLGGSFEHDGHRLHSQKMLMTWSPLTESNRRPSPYHLSTGSRCSHLRKPRSRSVAVGQLIWSSTEPPRSPARDEDPPVPDARATCQASHTIAMTGRHAQPAAGTAFAPRLCRCLPVPQVISASRPALAFRLRSNSRSHIADVSASARAGANGRAGRGTTDDRRARPYRVLAMYAAHVGTVSARADAVPLATWTAAPSDPGRRRPSATFLFE